MIDYKVLIQGIEDRAWRWSVTMDGMLVTGQAQTRSDAIAAVEKAIDEAAKPRNPRE
jgi:hypothetical protein